MNKLWTGSIISSTFTRVINVSCHNRPALKSQWFNTKVFIPIHTTSSTAIEGDWGWRRLLHSHSVVQAGKFTITWLSHLKHVAGWAPW